MAFSFQAYFGARDSKCVKALFITHLNVTVYALCYWMTQVIFTLKHFGPDFCTAFVSSRQKYSCGLCFIAPKDVVASHHFTQSCRVGSTHC